MILISYEPESESIFIYAKITQIYLPYHNNLYIKKKNNNLIEYIVHDEAIDFLRSVPGPIGVVGVAGMYRTGKSYLLN